MSAARAAGPRPSTLATHLPLVVAGIFVFSLVPAVVQTQAHGAEPDSTVSADGRSLRQRVVDERAAYGLPVNDAMIDALLDGGIDVGTPKWGIPVTAEEEKTLDLPGRMHFAELVNRELIPFVENLPTYGGAWFDQRDAGGLVVLLTELDDATIDSIEAVVPQPSLGLRFIKVSHTLKTLEDLVQRLPDEWRSIRPEVRLAGTGIDVVANGLTLSVFPEDVAEGRTAIDAVTSSMGVPVVIELQYGSDSRDTCTDRDWCANPLQLGDMIHRGSVAIYYPCTMGFHITINGDHQFLTAGHCGYFSSPNTWYHKDLQATNSGLVGGELATLYGPGGEDIMRVQMPNSQASERIFDLWSLSVPVDMNPSWGDAQVGEVLCRSAAKTDDIDCGTLYKRWTNWTSDTPDPDITVNGGRMNGIIQIRGDSGAPLYRQTYDPPGYWITAVGIMVHENGGFGWVKHAIQTWGGSLYDG